MMKQEQVRRLLVRAERARKHLMQPHFTRIGLTFGQGHARILDVLLARDHITQKELSDLCHMDVPPCPAPWTVWRNPATW